MARHRRGCGWHLALALGVLLGLGEQGRTADPAPPVASSATPAPPPPVPPDADRLAAFLNSGAFRTWPRDKEIRCIVGHDTWGRVYYSPDVVAWLKAGRPPEGVPDGALIVKEMYDDEAGTKISGWAVMNKYKAGSFDGWFWGGASPGSDEGSGQYGFFPCVSCHASADNRELTFADLGHIDGTVHEDDSWCRQASTEAPAASPTAAKVTRKPRPRPRLAHGALATPEPTALPSPLPAPDPEFTKLYRPPLPGPIPTPPVFPPVSAQPWLVDGPTGPDPFLVSGNCQGCHDGGRWLVLPKGVFQNMVLETPRETLNLSPYAEWSASLMGLAGRDPIFHAQLESEKALRPQMAAYLDDTCYRCHGVMGQRQIALDRHQGFQHFMVYAQPGDPSFKYGALARDGVSCTVCHHVSAEGLGQPATFTGSFEVGPPNEMYGPFSDAVKTRPMRNALGITPRGARHITSSALCGSCHVVILPQVPSESRGRTVDDGTFPTAHEQTTYLEWRWSAYQDERPPVDVSRAKACHACHMPRTYSARGQEPRDLRFRIANVEDYRFPDPQPPNLLPRAELDLEERPFSRHTLVALNLTGMQLFQQFWGLLGIPAADMTSSHAYDGQPPTTSNLVLAGRESLRLAEDETARVEVTSLTREAGRVEATVRVTNLAGHKMPSGVGFRRAWIELKVRDPRGEVVWASGATEGMGVIVGPGGRPLTSELSRDPRHMQPHYELIEREDQVQIYEERTLDDQGRLTTSFLGRFEEVKDNRLVPLGFPKPDELPEYLRPRLPAPDGNGSSGRYYDDRAYTDGSGSDVVVYRVRGNLVPPGSTFEATLYYQSIPPYYLRDRFETASGIETQRLYWMASRLDLEGTAVEGWKLRVARAIAR